MLKLYRLNGANRDYWETWEQDSGTHVVHWGRLGTRGESRAVTSTSMQQAEAVLQREVDELVSQGYAPVDPDDHAVLLVEHAVDGMGNAADLDKRHRLEDRLSETLGWTGLGACDGGSIGSGSMEVCCLVVEFELARKVIEADLAGTEFADYRRIFEETDD